jgi:hypothetical protein
MPRLTALLIACSTLAHACCTLRSPLVTTPSYRLQYLASYDGGEYYHLNSWTKILYQVALELSRSTIEHRVPSKFKRCKMYLNETSKQRTEIVMISPSVILSATSSMHNLPINRGVPPILPYAIASFHLLSIFLLQIGIKFTT